MAAAVFGAVVKGMPTPHVSRAAPLAAAVAKVTPMSVPSQSVPLPELPTLVETTLDRFLTGLDAAAKAVKAADTTARKDELRARAKTWATEALLNKRLTVRCRITDVRIPKEGAAEVRFASPNLGAYGTNSSHSLYLNFPGHVTLALSKEKTLTIGTRQTLEVTGAVEFVAGAGDVLGDVFFGREGLVGGDDIR